MINVGRITLSRNFAQPAGFIVYRITGDWVKGRFVAVAPIELKLQGTITVAAPKDLMQVPEGDRVTGLMCFFSMQEIFVTRTEGISDEILWQGERYRVSAVVPWQDFGYYKAFGVRMAGD